MKNRFWWNIAMGAGDGVVIPFLFAAALAGAGVEPIKIFYISFLVLIAGTILISVSSALSSKEQLHQFDSSKYSEEEIEREWKTEDSRMEFLNLNQTTRQQAKEEFREEKTRWKTFIQNFELNQDETTKSKTWYNSVTIGLAYFGAGLFAIHAFYFNNNTQYSFYFGLFLVVVITAIVAILKSYINKEQFLPLFAYAEILLLVAIGAVYLAGRLFH